MPEDTSAEQGTAQLDPGHPEYICSTCYRPRHKHTGGRLCTPHEHSAIHHLISSMAAGDHGHADEAERALRQASVYSQLALTQEVRRLEETLRKVAVEFWPRRNGGAS